MLRILPKCIESRTRIARCCHSKLLRGLSEDEQQLATVAADGSVEVKAMTDIGVRAINLKEISQTMQESPGKRGATRRVVKLESESHKVGYSSAVPERSRRNRRRRIGPRKRLCLKILGEKKLRGTQRSLVEYFGLVSNSRAWKGRR